MKFRPFGLQVIPDNWDITTVSSVANVVSRGKQPKYKNTGTMVLNQKMIQNDGIHYEFAKRHDIDKQIRPDLFLKNYDIVLNSTGTGTAGRSQIFLEKPKEKMFLDSHVTLIRPDTDKINPVFLFAQIHDSRFVKYIEDVLLAGSTGQVELSKAKVLEMPILLPPKQVQNKFGILYETIMKKQELIGTINDNLVALAGTIWRNFDVYESKEVRDLFDVKYGKTMPKTQLTSTGVPVFGANGMIGYTDKPVMLPDYSVVITSRGSGSGDVQLMDKGVFMTNNLLTIESKHPQSNWATWQMLKQANIQGAVTGSAQPQLTIENFARVVVNIPDKDTIQKFNEVSENFEQIYWANKNEIKLLTETRDTLLRKLIG